MVKKRDLAGQKFARLTVVQTGPTYGKKTRWFCHCDCGAWTLVTTSHLVTGQTKSCGCAKSESGKVSYTKHGLAHSKAYQVWHAMVQRCYRETCRSYPRYGGRGIKICERWHRFENFYEDMGNPPKSYSLDRIDNSLGYSKENCRWATWKEQQNNRRSNRYHEISGERLTLSQIAMKYDIKYSTLKSRISRGRTIDEAIAFAKEAEECGLSH